MAGLMLHRSDALFKHNQNKIWSIKWQCYHYHLTDQCVVRSTLEKKRQSAEDVLPERRTEVWISAWCSWQLFYLNIDDGSLVVVSSEADDKCYIPLLCRNPAQNPSKDPHYTNAYCNNEPSWYHLWLQVPLHSRITTAVPQVPRGYPTVTYQWYNEGTGGSTGQ